jgi:hypothetical protein
MSIRCDSNSTTISGKCYKNCDISIYYENKPSTIYCYKKYLGFEDNSGNTNTTIRKKEIAATETMADNCWAYKSNLVKKILDSNLLIHYTFNTENVNGTTVYNVANLKYNGPTVPNVTNLKYNGTVKTGGITDFADGPYSSKVLKMRKGGGLTVNSIKLTSIKTYSISFRMQAFGTGFAFSIPTTINNVTYKNGLETLYINNVLRIQLKASDTTKLSYDFAVGGGYWKYIVIVVDNNNTKLYNDGSLQSEFKDFSIIQTNDFTLNLGAEYDGYIEDFKLYDRALDGSEITEAYTYKCPILSCNSGYTPNNNVCTGNCPAGITISDGISCTRETVLKQQTLPLRPLGNLTSASSSMPPASSSRPPASSSRPPINITTSSMPVSTILNTYVVPTTTTTRTTLKKK